MKCRLLREQKTLENMIGIYCSGLHNQKSLCNDCNSLLEYAAFRLSKCIYGELKPVCARCTVHCYKPEMREKIKQVMRYSGKRMLIRYPVTTVQHLIDALNNRSNTGIQKGSSRKKKARLD